MARFVFIFLCFLGTSAYVKPSRAASLIRFSKWGIERISPPSPISPNVMMFFEIGLSLSADTMAVATARSAARSLILMPPETLMNTS